MAQGGVPSAQWSTKQRSLAKRRFQEHPRLLLQDGEHADEMAILISIWKRLNGNREGGVTGGMSSRRRDARCGRQQKRI